MTDGVPEVQSQSPGHPPRFGANPTRNQRVSLFLVEIRRIRRDDPKEQRFTTQTSIDGRVAVRAILPTWMLQHKTNQSAGRRSGRVAMKNATIGFLGAAALTLVACIPGLAQTAKHQAAAGGRLREKCRVRRLHRRRRAHPVQDVHPAGERPLVHVRGRAERSRVGRPGYHQSLRSIRPQLDSRPQEYAHRAGGHRRRKNDHGAGAVPGRRRHRCHQTLG